MKFYNVQIPYRGGIPVIMKKGPIASIELSEDQIRELMECKVPLMNPVDGAEFVLPTENMSVVQVAPGSTIEPIEPAPVITVEEEKPNTDQEADDPKEEETPVNEPETETVTSPVSEGVLVEPSATPAPAPVDPQVSTVKSRSPALDFDYTKVEGYSSMSKSKKREIRAMYVMWIENGKTAEEAYAAINAK